MRNYLLCGGSIAILMGEFSEEVMGTNINAFAEQFGMSINADSVVRAAPYKHLHPKEVFISQGLLNPEVMARLGYVFILTCVFFISIAFVKMGG